MYVCTYVCIEYSCAISKVSRKTQGDSRKTDFTTQWICQFCLFKTNSMRGKPICFELLTEASETLHCHPRFSNID